MAQIKIAQSLGTVLIHYFRVTSRECNSLRAVIPFKETGKIVKSAGFAHSVALLLNEEDEPPASGAERRKQRKKAGIFKCSLNGRRGLLNNDQRPTFSWYLLC
jgi:hypothetical protein